MTYLNLRSMSHHNTHKNSAQRTKESYATSAVSGRHTCGL